MELTALKIPETKIKQLNKAGIESVEDLIAYYPKKYIDRTKLTGIDSTAGHESVFLFHAVNIRFVNSRTPLIKMQGYDCDSKTPVYVLWFNQSYLYDTLREMISENILVAGQAVYQPPQYNAPARYEVNSPAVFCAEGQGGLGVYPVYRKVRGMAEEYLQSCIQKAATVMGPPSETVPERFLTENTLIRHADMVAELHWPSSIDSVEAALRRKMWDELLYFALRIELNYLGAAIGSPFGVPLLRTTKAVINSLPFTLTRDQQATVDGTLAQIRSGKRLNALIQGDVGCGKTIIAMLLMIAMAENGYQAVLMAPTQILAKQHYDKLVQLTQPYGIKVAFVSGQKLRKAEQTALEQSISFGETKLIVGTQALLSSNYQFSRLAMVVEDEEHKYGVLQRKALADKAAEGTHLITMSATPIPRSLAQTLYGDNVQLFSIHTKPEGRQPIRTGIASSMDRVFSFLRSEVQSRGHQAYVVCPMIAANEKMEGVATAEDTYKMYCQALSPYGITVGIVTGKTKKSDAQQIIQDFSGNRINILVSTTVIEVGVDVPNATCIIIHNAERFGLAQLHQLRGRVGRGSAQGWCVLVSQQSDNERLMALCNHTDGFEIAEIDLQQRGAGNLLGNEQSGVERLFALAMQHQEEYAIAQAEAKRILRDGDSCLLLEQAIEDRNNNIGGEMISDT